MAFQAPSSDAAACFMHHGIANLLLECMVCAMIGLLTADVCMCRIAPHVTMTLVALEAIKAYEKKIGL